MAANVVTMQQLLEAGAHFGHQTHRWNPRMKPYIFGDRNGVHIIDLSQSVPLFARALDFVQQTAARGGKALGAQPIDRRFHLAIVLGQRLLAIHHAGASALAQFLHRSSGDLGHIVAPCIW
jgi:hypothetical protein